LEHLAKTQQLFAMKSTKFIKVNTRRLGYENSALHFFVSFMAFAAARLVQLFAMKNMKLLKETQPHPRAQESILILHSFRVIHG